MRSLRAGLFTGAVGLAIAATACSSGSSGATSAAAASSAPDATSAAAAGSLAGKTIALLGYGDSNPWGAAFNKQFASDLAATGVKMSELTTMDSGTQVQYFNQAIAQKPDLIVLAVDDTKATVVPIEQAKAAGIPVLAFDGPTDPSVAN
ncbi:MAG: sugar ABC transporter substrate-binding protein, partial [Trebonia sp.]